MDKLSQMALYAEIEELENKFDKSKNIEEREQLKRKIEILQTRFSTSAVSAQIFDKIR
ncbi:MAG: hypothetical protein ACI4N3_03685 [Alphaproteobacteria bacterium]